MEHWNVTFRNVVSALEVEVRGVVAETSKEAGIAAKVVLTQRDYFEVDHITHVEPAHG